MVDAEAAAEIRCCCRTDRTILLAGAGASNQGEHPFLDRFNLDTKQTERIFQCAPDKYETVEAVLDDSGNSFITRRESKTEPPNYILHVGAKETALTDFKDPAPQVRKITKQLVTYKRADGVPLSMELYLPPDYKPGTRLPAVVWAYPREYDNPATAGQVDGSPNRFTTITGYSELFFLLDGYAVLENAAMPVVGSIDVVNNTYVEQIVADAKAAIDKAAEMGVIDPNRVGVGGHSYGAFMTANLLAHCNLFRAGIAESGAYNRTLTPFGFQSERRTLLGSARHLHKMSPFFFADKIKDADSADSRRGGRQLRNVPDSERSHVSGHSRQWRYRAAGVPARRSAWLSRQGNHRAPAVGEIQLVRQIREERTGADVGGRS